MSFDIVLKTTIPIFFLIGLGFLSRKGNILLLGDERVLSSYVFYFALPALFIVNIAEKKFTFQILRYMFAGIAPLLIVLSIFWILYFIIRFPTNILYLLIMLLLVLTYSLDLCLLFFLLMTKRERGIVRYSKAIFELIMLF